jgi:hypothetical protein
MVSLAMEKAFVLITSGLTDRVLRSWHPMSHKDPSAS